MILFPALCHFSVIADDREGTKEAIAKVFADASLSVSVHSGCRSEQGKFVAYHADVTVESLELMRLLDNELRRIPGVQVVL